MPAEAVGLAGAEEGVGAIFGFFGNMPELGGTLAPSRLAPLLVPKS